MLRNCLGFCSLHPCGLERRGQSQEDAHSRGMLLSLQLCEQPPASRRLWGEGSASKREGGLPAPEKFTPASSALCPHPKKGEASSADIDLCPLHLLRTERCPAVGMRWLWGWEGVWPCLPRGMGLLSVTLLATFFPIPFLGSLCYSQSLELPFLSCLF